MTIQTIATSKAGSTKTATSVAGRLRRSLLLCLLAGSAVGADQVAALEPSTDKLLQTFENVDGTPGMDRAASQAARQLQQLSSQDIAKVLSGFSSASQRGRNWLRAVAADVSDNGPFPKQILLDFFANRGGDPDARYVAFQLLTQQDPDLKPDLLRDAATDPSLPIRYLKIESLLDRAGSARSDSPEQAKALLREVVDNARSPKQLERAAKMLGELGQPVDVASELGMFQSWWLIGPFDNTDSEDFDTAYVVENRYLETGNPIAVDSQGEPKSEQGKQTSANWQKINSDDSLGMVDLNEPLNNAKDAAAYVFATFEVEEEAFDPNAQIRIGCITANKVWVNGKLVSANNVYHSGTRIDQYVDDCTLVKGENTVLIKVLQNAQTEPWAQDWEFQFRLTRPDGSAIKTAVLENND